MEGNDAAPEDVATLDLRVALVASEKDLVEPPQAFLNNVSEMLKATHGVDADLAAILSEHLLTVAPHSNVVVNAKAAILALASKRVAPAEEQHG